MTSPSEKMEFELEMSDRMSELGDRLADLSLSLLFPLLCAGHPLSLP
jgi:hypothetical protein